MTAKRKRTLIAVAVFILLVSGVAMHAMWRHARGEARKTMCVHNLKQVAIALQHYAEDHDGNYPDTLSALYPEYLYTLEIFICPEVRAVYQRNTGTNHPFTATPGAGDIDALASYTLVPGLRSDGDSDLVIAYEKEDNHAGMGRSLLYLDGHGAWEPPENWRNAPPNVNLPEGF